MDSNNSRKNKAWAPSDHYSRFVFSDHTNAQCPICLNPSFALAGIILKKAGGEFYGM